MCVVNFFLPGFLFCNVNKFNQLRFFSGDLFGRKDKYGVFFFAQMFFLSDKLSMFVTHWPSLANCVFGG